MTTNIRTYKRPNAKALPWSVEIDGTEYARFLSEGLANQWVTTGLKRHLENAEKALASLKT